MTGKHAGAKPGNPAASSNISIIRSCDKCPLSVYIDLVCNDNLRALIESGEPAEEELEIARMELVSEFHVLLGNHSAMTGIARRLALYRTQVMGLRTAIALLSAGQVDKAASYLRENGVRISRKEFDGKALTELITRTESKMRAINVRIKEESKRYKDMSAKKGSAPTPEMFNDQLVILSKHVGFRLTKDITLAEYAGYMKDYKNSLNYGKDNKK